MRTFLTLLFTLVIIKLSGQTDDDSWKALNQDGSNFIPLKIRLTPISGISIQILFRKQR